LESFQIFNEILQADEAVRQFEDIPMTSWISIEKISLCTYPFLDRRR
jgi:hypothetical protein